MKHAVSRCPIEEAMLVLSGRWPTLLLYYLKDGPKRFSELRRDNPTVSHRMLSLELRKLEAAGIVRRTAHGGYPLRVDYGLTEAGLKLVPLIDALGNWWEETEAQRSTPAKTSKAAQGNSGALHFDGPDRSASAASARCDNITSPTRIS